MEEAERTIEDGEMCSRMARQDMSRTRVYDSDDRSEKDAMWEGVQNRTYFM
jgi:hypothetical protein